MADSRYSTSTSAAEIRGFIYNKKVVFGPNIVMKADSDTFVKTGTGSKKITDQYGLFFKVTLEEGAHYSLIASGDYQPEMVIYDWDGYYQSSVDGDDLGSKYWDKYGTDTIYDYQADYTGDHWLWVGWEYLDDATGTIRVSVYQSDEPSPIYDKDDIRKADVDDAEVVGRLYQAVLGRTPDEPGLSWWIDQWEKGVDSYEMAARMYDSAEFKARFGENLSDHDFMSRIYENILGRQADQAGIDFYESALQAGSKTREQVIAEFSESSENIILVGNRFDDLHYSGGNEWYLSFA